jgi:hypothetical protein
VSGRTGAVLDVTSTEPRYRMKCFPTSWSGWREARAAAGDERSGQGADASRRWVSGPTVTVDLDYLFWPWGTDATS